MIGYWHHPVVRPSVCDTVPKISTGVFLAGMFVQILWLYDVKPQNFDKPWTLTRQL